MSKEIQYHLHSRADLSDRQKQTMVEQTDEKIFWKGKF